MEDAFPNRPTKFADFVAILRRRKWFVVVPLVLAPLVALIASSTEKTLYRATADVFLERTSVVSAVADVGDPALGDPERFLTNQASVARSSELARRVVAAARLQGVTPGTLLGESDVSPRGDADLLNFAVTDADPHRAVVLANAYARQFTSYKTQLDTARIDAALRVLRRRLEWIQAHPQVSFPSSYGRLLEQLSQLETVGKLLANSATIVQTAASATQVQPRTKRNVLLAAGLGGLLALAFTFLSEALDRRVRTEREIEDALGVPVIARVPAPSRRLRRADELVMLAEPGGLDAEVFRMLRTEIEFADSESKARMIMVTSAMQREGKSTTLANLALAFARARRRVVVVDLDLRRPSLARLFRVSAVPGVTELAMEQVTLAESMRPIPVTPVSRPYVGSERLIGPDRRDTSESDLDSVLYLLPGGTVPASPAEVVESESVSAALEELRRDYDFVLIDSPPLAAFGDAMALAARVDAVIAIARVGFVARQPLEDFGRELRSCGAKSLGVVLCGATGRSGYYEAYRYLAEAGLESERTRP